MPISRAVVVGKMVNPTLADVGHRLEAAFDAAGYVERSYYSVPEGFAIVSQLEQMNADGTPKPDPERWSIRVPPTTSLHLSDYIKALFTARTGYYRLVVFVVTDQTFGAGATAPTGEAARDWLVNGGVWLPQSIAERSFANGYEVTALIYEFDRTSEEAIPRLKTPSEITGQAHLQKAKLWAALTNP